MNKSFFFSLCATAALLFPALCAAGEDFPVIHNEPISIRVLSGRDGRPQPGVHLLLRGGYDQRDLARGQWREEAITDPHGAIQLSNGLRNLPWMRVEMLHGHACAAAAASVTFNVDLVRREGASGVNRCGIQAAANEAGVLTLYVKGKKPAIPASIAPDNGPDAVSSNAYGLDPVLISMDDLHRPSSPKPGVTSAPPLSLAAPPVPAHPLPRLSAAANPAVANPAMQPAPLSDSEIDDLVAGQP